MCNVGMEIYQCAPQHKQRSGSLQGIVTNYYDWVDYFQTPSR